jgi:carbon monoxide dehydrogenase subunit G
MLKTTKQGLLFMPDISGFTEFVQHTEVKHSKHIVKELLELLIDQNTIGLKLAEVEGDALFFYKDEANISPAQLVGQIKSMYQAFHQHLLIYKYRRICNCGACTNAEGLRLKFVIHEAEIEFIDIKGNKKPFGEEVIKLHRLLKNQVPENEYALFSSEYLSDKNQVISTLFGQPPHIIEQDFDFGIYQYGYHPINQFKKSIEPTLSQPVPFLGRKLFSKTIELPHSPNDVFQFIIDFDHRGEWSEGVDQLEYAEGEINRVGSKHTCVIGNSRINLASIYTQVEKEDMIFIESTEDAPIIKNLSTVYRVSPADRGSKVQVDFHTKSTSFIGKIFTPLLKFKLGGNAGKSLDALSQALGRNSS